MDSGNGGGAADASWQKVVLGGELSPDRPCGAVASGVELVLVQSSGGLRAYQAQCPHQGTLLSEGEIVKDQLVCRAHGWRFDLATGERDLAPRQCLRAYPVKSENGEVLVQLGTKPAAPAQSLAVTARRTLADIPGPGGLPIFGTALQVDLPRLHLMLEDWARQYGSIYRIRIMSHTALVISEPALIEELLRNRPQALRRTSNLERVFAEMGTAGVFSAEGSAWRAQRRLAMQALSNRHQRVFFPTLRRVAERLRERWAKAAASPEPIDIDADLMRFTVDVTTSLVFSTDMNTLGDGNDALQGHLSRVFPAFARRLLAPFPYWRYLRLPTDRALDRSLAEVRKVQERLITETRARLDARDEAEPEPRDFIEAMLLARDDDGNPFSDEVIYGNMMTMLLAGEDTTAHTLAWAVHLLCDRPDVMARMRREVDDALGEHLTPHDFESAQKFPYLDAVANETMRLKPVAPFMGLEANEDMVVSDIQIPKGTWLDVLTRLPTLSPDNFSDPETFKPERWLNELPQDAAHKPNVSVPFGSGPRICPGRTLALLEMRVVLATLVRSFDVERVGAADAVTERFSFTVSPEGLRVRLRPRAAAAVAAAE